MARHLSEETKQKLSKINTGKKLSEETKEKISTTSKGRIFSEEHKRKISEANRKRAEAKGPKPIAKPCACGCGKMTKPGSLFISGHNRKGKKASKETKQKMSNALKGKSKTPEQREKLSKAKKGTKHTPETIAKMSETRKGKKKSPEHITKISENAKNRRPEKTSKWKGGVHKYNLSLYDAYAHQLTPMEEVCRDVIDERLLKVKCTYCGKWFIPSRNSVLQRIEALDGRLEGESRFYCSDGCKSKCSIYHKSYNHNPSDTSAETPAWLRKQVFERDNYECQKCYEKEKPLECHHIKTQKCDPIEAWDVDSCITFCEKCHDKVHHQPGCTYNELRNYSFDKNPLLDQALETF